MTLILSGVAIIVSAISMYLSNQANKKSSNIQISVLETQIHNTIQDAEADENKCGMELHGISDGEKKFALKYYMGYVERKLNAYDQACTIFFSSDINKENFIESYAKAIKQLVDNESLAKYFQKRDKYKSIIKFYDRYCT